MSLVPSLLQAIVRVDGDAFVMHAGDKPYVVSPTGQVELASRGLTLEAVNGIVAQLLPIEIQHALDEFGAVQHELAPMAEFPGERFTVVVARGGDDVWAEIRRRRMPESHQVPDEFFASSPPHAVASQPAVSRVVPAHQTGAAHSAPADDNDELPVELREFDTSAAEEVAPQAAEAAEVPELDDDLLLPDAGQLWPGQQAPARARGVVSEATPDEAFEIDVDRDTDEVEPEPEFEPEPMPVQPAARVRTPLPALAPPPIPSVTAAPPVRRVVAPVALPVAPAAPTRQAPPIAASVEPLRQAPPPQQPAVVLNMSRNPVRSETPPPAVEDPTLSGLERLLRVSSARGASTLYLSSESRPSVRVDGELQLLDGEPVHVARDVESLLLTLMPERSHEALRTGAATEWICDLEGVGRVRCMSFRDQRGPGGVFRLMPTRSVSADQLGLPKQVVALAIEPEGLILVVGPRSSGKRTTMAAFVDLMNRTRRDHIITIEREINIRHERGNSFISQREVRGSDEDMVTAARAALREDPDVLVIEDLRTGPLMNVALEAAAAGRLVVGGFSAHTATGAIDRIIDLYAPEYRHQVQMALADSMRGVIAQVLLRKVGGGRLPAREVLLNTPAVSSAIAEGKTSQLPMAIEGGRRYGMMPLNDTLVGLVQSGTVEGREAYRHSPDRPGFLAALNRQGVDTSFVDRLANG
jgi:twitching motility protein PilT